LSVHSTPETKKTQIQIMTTTSATTEHKAVVSHEPAEIIEGHIYLGSVNTAHSLELLQKHNITYIINVSQTENKFPETVTYYSFNVDDNERYNIYTHFESVFEIMVRAKEEKKRILIHCQAGVSRSPTFVIAYLIQHQKMNLKDALSHVKAKRPQVQPNRGFIRQLIMLEETIHGTVSFTFESYLINQLVKVGFTREKAEKAIQDSHSDFNAAVDLLLEEVDPDEDDDNETELDSTITKENKQVEEKSKTL